MTVVKTPAISKLFMYYLKLSGFIPESKRMEFEQTYRLVNKKILPTCEGYNISRDVLDEGVYHFVSYWSLPSHLQLFSHSAAFLMMMGAFKALGELREHASGEMTRGGS